METLLQDIRFALRTLRKGWLITGVAVLSLALAIGGNAAVFSMVDAFIFRPLSFESPEEVVLFGERPEDQPAGQGGALFTSLATYADLAERAKTIETWGAIQIATLNVRGSDRTEPVSGVRATPGFFDVLETSAWRGRTFLPGEGVEGARRVALLSYEYWVRRFGEGSAPLGEVLTVDGEPHEVVGILPQGFEFLTPNQDLWVPLRRSPQSVPRDRRDALAVGRMREGANMDQVRAEIEGVFAGIATEHPDAMRGQVLDAYNLRYDFPTSQTRTLFALLQGSVLLVLLIACVNITNLLLARGQERAREIALRTALGAGRGRIVRQLLTESAIMVAAAAALGVGLGWLGIRATARQWAALLPAQYELAMDGRVLLFTLAVAVLSGLFFGLLPALQTFRSGQAGALRDGARGSGGRSKKVISRVLVVGEIALSFVALGGGALLMRSFLDIRDSDPGFETGPVLTALVTIPGSKVPDAEQASILNQEVLERARAVAGVTHATLTNSVPQNFQAPQDSFRIAGEAIDAGAAAPRAMRIKVSPEFLETLGAGLVQGRFFEAGDRLGGAPVAVVNRAFAEARFPGGGVLGARLEMADETREIVGVIDDIDQVTFRTPGQTTEAVYVPVAQEPERVRWLLVRAAGDPQRLKEPLRRAVEQIDPDLTLSQLFTMDEFTDRFFVGINVFNAVLGVFGALALLMAALGTYGVLAYSVSQRGHEIGVRLAVGARPREVVRMIARQGIVLGVIGLILGAIMTLPLVGLMNQLLQGLSSVKPYTLVIIGSVLFGVTVVASLVPAGRAAAVDPVRTLRDE